MNVCIILMIYILIANAVAILNRGKIKTQRFSCISPWNKMFLHRIAILGDVTRCLASSNKNIFTNFFLRPCISHETKAVKNPTVRNRCIFTIFSNLDFSVKRKLLKALYFHGFFPILNEVLYLPFHYDDQLLIHCIHQKDWLDRYTYNYLIMISFRNGVS